MIPAEQYSQIIEVLPILCVDVVVSNPVGEILLIKRSNEPLKGQWWVIGGRVLKGETLEEAAIRKVREEATLVIESAKPIGYYEDTAEKNPLGLESVQHAVSVVFSAKVDSFQQTKLDYQSSDWKCSKELPSGFHCNWFGGDQWAPGRE